MVNDRDEQAVSKEIINELVKQLRETNLKIKHLENRINMVHARSPKPFPDVKYLNYHNKRRILVRTELLFFNYKSLII